MRAGHVNSIGRTWICRDGPLGSFAVIHLRALDGKRAGEYHHGGRADLPRVAARAPKRLGKTQRAARLAA
jgi:hypothetical protein